MRSNINLPPLLSSSTLLTVWEIDSQRPVGQCTDKGHYQIEEGLQRSASEEGDQTFKWQHSKGGLAGWPPVPAL